MCNVLRTAWRAGRPAVLHLIALLIALPLSAGSRAPPPRRPLKGEVSATIENGYARLALPVRRRDRGAGPPRQQHPHHHFPASGRHLDRPHQRQHAAGYVSAARRDPDGKGIRIALARKVTMNSMAAGERLFVDLLPDTWTGLAPGPAARRHRRARPPRPRGRAARPPAARAGAAAARWRRSGCGRSPSRPSRATCSTCRS